MHALQTIKISVHIPILCGDGQRLNGHVFILSLLLLLNVSLPVNSVTRAKRIMKEAIESQNEVCCSVLVCILCISDHYLYKLRAI